MTDIPSPPSSAASRPSSLWWAYFAILILFGIGGVASLCLQIVRGGVPVPYVAIGAVAALLNFAGVAALWGYILAKPLLVRPVWQAVFALTVVQLLFSAAQFARVLGMPGGGVERTVAITGVLSLVFAAPLVWVLWVYAFGASGAWEKR